MFYFPDILPLRNDTLNYRLLTRPQLNIPGLHMMGHAKLPTAADTLPLHYHYNMEFVAVVNGRQQYVVDGNRYILHGGDILMTFPKEPHGSGAAPQEVCEFIWFQFDYSSPTHFLGLWPPYDAYLFQQLSGYKKRTAHISQKELLLLSRSFRLLSLGDSHYHLMGYSCFLEFVTKNLCFAGEPFPAEEDDDFLISNATDYIHSHLLENPTLECIARFCNMSPAKLNDKFKIQMGMTPHAYILALKIDTAKILLKDPKNSVTEVALQLNFSSSNHFSSVFKKYTGYTPTFFREQQFSDLY